MIERKSLRDLSWQVDEPTYREDPALSYSTIAKFNRKGFEGLDSLFEHIDTPSLTFGSMVDTLITDGEEAFNEKYFTASFPKVQDDFVPVVKAIAEEIGEQYSSLDSISNEEIVNYLTRFNIYTSVNWKEATKADKFRDNTRIYYQMLLLSNGKTVVSSEMAQDARDCVECLRTHPATKWYFQQDNPFDEVERFYQLKFKGEYEGIPLRCMMDLVIVDHKNKLIIPCDLKTSSKPEYKFYLSFIEWNYYIQAGLYSELLRQNIKDDPYFKDFKIVDYRFLVICNKTRNPKVWEWRYTWTIEDIKINNVIIRNWRSIVKELNYYLKYQPMSPVGIKEETLNDIKEWLEKIEK